MTRGTSADDIALGMLRVHLWDLVDENGNPHDDVDSEDVAEFFEQLREGDAESVVAVCQLDHPLTALVGLANRAALKTSASYGERDIYKMCALRGDSGEWADFAIFVGNHSKREMFLNHSRKHDHWVIEASERANTPMQPLPIPSSTAVATAADLDELAVRRQSEGTTRRNWPALVAAAGLLLIASGAAGAWLSAHFHEDTKTAVIEEEVLRLRGDLEQTEQMLTPALSRVSQLEQQMEEERTAAAAAAGFRDQQIEELRTALDDVRSGLEEVGSHKVVSRTRLPWSVTNQVASAGEAVRDVRLPFHVAATNRPVRLSVHVHIGTPENLPYADNGRRAGFRVRLIDSKGGVHFQQLVQNYTKVEQASMTFETVLAASDWDGQGSVVLDQFFLADTNRVAFRSPPQISVTVMRE